MIKYDYFHYYIYTTSDKVNNKHKLVFFMVVANTKGIHSVLNV